MGAYGYQQTYQGSDPQPRSNGTPLLFEMSRSVNFGGGGGGLGTAIGVLFSNVNLRCLIRGASLRLLL